MMRSPRRIVTRCFASVVLASVVILAGAQSFPSRNIRFVGIATPGTTSDVIGRTVGEPLGRQIGVSVVVENRPGAGGTLAAGAVARAEPDGHTLLLTSSAQSGMSWLYTKLPFHPVKDFSGITALAELPSVLVVPPQRGWKTLNDMIAAAKARPGALNFGSGGTGSGTHLSSEKLMLGAGITANHVPFKGTSEGLIEVIAGRLDWFYTPAAAVVSLLKDGKLKSLIVSSKTRMSLLPELPTAAEAGLAEAEYVFWVGLLAPRKTPRAAINKLNGEIVKVMGSAELRERFRQLGAEPFPMKPAELDAFLAADTEVTGRIVKAANIKPQ
jgi:tripartite-type tricarboxylate transporter receptor subunit TctC